MQISGLKPQIYGMSMLKSWDIDQLLGLTFLRIFMKKWSSPNSSRIIPGSFPELQGIKKPSKIFKSSFGKAPGASGKNPKKSSENIVLNDFLDLFFQIFPCWRMYCPCGGPRGPSLSLNTLTRRAYSVCFRVIRRQRGARLNFSVNRHFEEIRASGSQVGDVLHNRLSP